MYAVVAPGFSGVFTNWKDVERIKALYPYPKWIKVQSEETAREWLRRNAYGWKLHGVYNYGNTLDDFYIDAKYRIAPDCVYYVLDVSRVGSIKIRHEAVIVEYHGDKIYMRLPNIKLSNETVAGHMSAIYNLIKIVGDYLDINIELPYYSLFYCLSSYTGGNSRPIALVQELISNRIGAVAYSLKLEHFSMEENDNE